MRIAKITLGLTAVFIGIVFMMYQSVKSSRKVNADTEINSIRTIQEGIHRLYASTANYSTLTTPMIISAKIPSPGTISDSSSTGIKNSFGGTVMVQPHWERFRFNIITDNIPRAECTIIAAELSGYFQKIVVNETVVKDMSETDMKKANIAAIELRCREGGRTNTITVTSF